MLLQSINQDVTFCKTCLERKISISESVILVRTKCVSVCVHVWVLRDDQKERSCHDSREMVELINSDPAVLDALVTCDESWISCYDLETKRQSSQWKHAGSPRPKKARQSKSTHKLLMIPFFDSTGMIYMHWVLTGLTVNEEYYGEVLREFRKKIPSEEASTLQIGSVAFPPGQYTSPQLHPFLRLFDQDGSLPSL